MISPANFFIFQNFDFGVFIGVKGQKMTYNYQFQYVLLYISGTVDHQDFDNVFLYIFVKMQYCKY